MAFPTDLDSLTNPSATDPMNLPDHEVHHDTSNDAVEAIEAKVGIDSSAVTSSHDYKLTVHRCLLYKAASFALGTAYTVITFTAANEVEDVGNLHEDVTNPSRITVARAGTYLVTATAKFAAPSTVATVLALAITKNGTRFLDHQHTADDATEVSLPKRFDLTCAIKLAANDYLELYGRSAAGAAVTETRFGVCMIPGAQT